MNITEAIAELRRGKTIQRTDWHPAGPYVILDSNGVM